MYRYELHMHTCMGSACARNTIEEMITAYKKAGYAGMAVTEHFIRGNTAVDRSLPWDELVTAYAAAYLKGREYAEKEDFDLLYKMYVMGYSYRELCQEMGLTKSALATRIHRIKERIRDELGLAEKST